VRSRIGSRERGRLSLELHDNLVQSLVALEMRLDVLERRGLAEYAVDVAEIKEIRAVLHNEILGVRDLMQRLKPVSVDIHRLPLELETILERFARSTGTAARLDWTVTTLDLPPRACREVVSVIQEALVNVRRHSGASQVRVRVESDAGGWGLIVDDNGHGLDVSGRFPHDHPEARRVGPRVIRERVTALGGTLTIVSSPAGLRLEMAFPPPQE
jgi:signal transduction histidine kinase